MLVQEFKLNAADTGSVAWLKIRKYAEDRLSELRAKNDNDLTHDETVKLRGRIAELKNLLDVGDLAPPACKDM